MPGNNLAIATVDISSDIGGVGINRYYLNTGLTGPPTPTMLTGWAEAILFLYNAGAAVIPDSVTYTIQPVVKVVDDESGGLITELPIPTPPAPIAGLGSSGYAAGSGIRLYWHTGTIANRRFIRGATYITPLASAAYDSNGGVSSTVVSTFVTAAASYIISATGTGGAPTIWHRPPKKTTTGGISGTIISATATQQPGSLRSRRS